MNIFRKTLNHNGTIVILLVGFAILFFWNDFVAWRENKIVEVQSDLISYVEITTSIYRVSNQCIKDHYTDVLTEDGMIFSVNAIKDDCDATYFEDFITIVRGEDDPVETKQQAIALYNKVKELGANATFMLSAVRKSVKTNEILQDWTRKLRDDEEYEHEKDDLEDSREKNQKIINPPDIYKNYNV